MNEQTLTLLDKYASIIGVKSEYVFEVLVHQAFINGVIDLITIVLLILFGVNTYNYREQIRKSSYLSADQYEVLLFGWWIGLIICFIIMVLLMNDVITSFINPEYQAIQELMNKI